MVIAAIKWKDAYSFGKKKSYDKHSILKSSNMAMLTKAHILKALVFPIIIYGCQCWTVRNVEHWRIDAFELWCWTRLLRIPWTARRSDQSILKEINLEFSLKDWCWSWSYNTLIIWYELPTHWIRLWCWERLRAGREEGDRGWDDWMPSLLQWA